MMFAHNKVLSYRDFDSHYIFTLFGFTISIRHKSKINYIPASTIGTVISSDRPQIIVSLTSYPARINSTAIAINTLLRQSLKPNRLVLWLAEEQFPNKQKDLPDELLRLTSLGLEIKWCANLMSYKKLIPALAEFPNDIIVTADDDLYYEEDWLESLYRAYLTDIKNIYVRRAKKWKVKDGNVVAYKKSELLSVNFKNPSFNNQLMSGSGCLFPPHSLHSDICRQENFMSIIPTQDDIYFWFMAILNGTKICVVNNNQSELIPIQGTQDDGLCKINKKNAAGMEPQIAIKKMLELYPEVMNIVREDAAQMGNVYEN